MRKSISRTTDQTLTPPNRKSQMTILPPPKRRGKPIFQCTYRLFNAKSLYGPIPVNGSGVYFQMFILSTGVRNVYDDHGEIDRVLCSRYRSIFFVVRKEMVSTRDGLTAQRCRSSVF